MLPEEQLVNSLLYKRAGLFDLYGQQSNLGGSVFTPDEDPLTSLLGSKFNEKYRNDYADTLHSGIFGAKNRLTSRTGARLLNDINEMNERGVAALNGLVGNKEKALSWIRNINDSRVGVGGYTQEAADKDFKDIESKINLASKVRNTGGEAAFSALAKKFVKGKLNSTITSIQGAMSDVPLIAKPFVNNITTEFANTGMDTNIGKKTSTSPTGKIDESKYSGATDVNKKENVKGNMFASMSKYLLPALLLGAAGGSLNKLRGGSILGPMLLMALLGSAYGVGRNFGVFGNSNNKVNKYIDSYSNKLNGALNKGMTAASKYVPFYRNTPKTAEYNNLKVGDLINLR